MTKQKILVSWSGGKDSALCVYNLLETGKFDIVKLITIMTDKYDRINLHGVRNLLLERQAEALKIGLQKIYISPESELEEYEYRLNQVLKIHLKQGTDTIAFGDINLDYVQKERLKNLGLIKMKAKFPLWKIQSGKIAKQFIDLGFKAVVVCVDPRFLDKSFVGRDFDREFLSQLPPYVDPCGEQGEFHTFTYAGPIFQNEVRCKVGDIVYRSTFYFADLLPED